MILPPGARSVGVGICRTERGLVCSGRPLTCARCQSQLRQQRKSKQRCITLAAAFKPCIDIHQASAAPLPKAYSSKEHCYSGAD